MKSEHNGWSNRETWIVNQWLHQYIDIQVLLKDHLDHPDAKQNAADFLKDFFGEICFPNFDGIYKDLLTLTLARVNWYELSSVYIDDELAELDRQKIAGYD